MPRDTVAGLHNHKRDVEPDHGRDSGAGDGTAADLSSDTWRQMRPENSVKEKGTKVEFPDPEKVEKGSTVQISVSVDGTPRNIYMHVPEHYNAAEPAAVLVVYNGWGDKPGPADDPKNRKPPVGKMARKCLSDLHLEPGASKDEIKAQFKLLVKRHHPDANGGDTGSEDRLREIIQAYNYLKQAGLC